MTIQYSPLPISYLIISNSESPVQPLCDALGKLKPTRRNIPVLTEDDGHQHQDDNQDDNQDEDQDDHLESKAAQVHIVTLENAIPLFANQLFDIIFIDFRQTHLDSSGQALSIIDTLTREAPGVSLVALIDNHQEANMDSCFARGLADYIVLTEINLDLLKRVVRYALSRKQSSDRISQLLQIDALTGLSNRHLCNDRISQAMIRAERSGQRVAVLLVDIDNFHGINETLGYEVGDMLLQETAKRLVSCVRRQDTVSRFGSDEFVLVLEGLNDPQHATVIAKQILQSFSEPIFNQDQPIFVSLSIGISVSEPELFDGQALLKQSDIARYRAKEHGGSCFQYYVPELNSEAQKQLNLERELNNALRRIFSKKNDS